MLGISRLLAAAVVLGLAWHSRPAAALEDGAALAARPDVAAGIAALQNTINASIAERDVPGLAIAVVADQQLVWAKGFGRADVATKVPVTPHTAFRVGSLTKLFTATAIVQLRDAGRLRLDDPVALGLPWFRVQEGPDDPPITLRDLLTHTSGLSRESGASSWNDRRFPTEAELDAAVVQEPPALPPETRWKYSNLAFAVAGQAVAAISGESWGHYVSAHILQPLGMTETWPVPNADIPGLATGYEPRYRNHREARGFIDLKALGPAGGAVSTVLDLARFAAEQMRETGPNLFLRPASLREMHRAQWVLPDFSAGQGLGFEVRRTGNQTFYGHGGSAGGYTSRLQIDPASRMAVIVLTNAEDGGPTAIVDSAFRLLGPAIARITATPRPVPVADPSWAKYVGTYASRNGESRIAILDGELVWLPADAADPTRVKIVLKPVRPNVFRYDSGSLIGEQLTFVLDAQGRVTRMDSVGFSDMRQ